MHAPQTYWQSNKNNLFEISDPSTILTCPLQSSSFECLLHMQALPFPSKCYYKNRLVLSLHDASTKQELVHIDFIPYDNNRVSFEVSVLQQHLQHLGLDFTNNDNTYVLQITLVKSLLAGPILIVGLQGKAALPFELTEQAWQKISACKTTYLQLKKQNNEATDCVQTMLHSSLEQEAVWLNSTIMSRPLLCTNTGANHTFTVQNMHGCNYHAKYAIVPRAPVGMQLNYRIHECCGGFEDDTKTCMQGKHAMTKMK